MQKAIASSSLLLDPTLTKIMFIKQDNNEYILPMTQIVDGENIVTKVQELMKTNYDIEISFPALAYVYENKNMINYMFANVSNKSITNDNVEWIAFKDIESYNIMPKLLKEDLLLFVDKPFMVQGTMVLDDNK